MLMAKMRIVAVQKQRSRYGDGTHRMCDVVMMPIVIKYGGTTIRLRYAWFVSEKICLHTAVSKIKALWGLNKAKSPPTTTKVENKPSPLTVDH